MIFPFVPYVYAKKAIFILFTSLYKIVFWLSSDVKVPVWESCELSKKLIVLSSPEYPVSKLWLFAVTIISKPKSFKFCAKASGVLKAGYPSYPFFRSSESCF